MTESSEIPKGAGNLNITGLSDSEALDQIGQLIDAAFDNRSASQSDHAFALLDQFQERDLAPELAVLTHYFRANIWAHRGIARTSSDPWLWEQSEQQEQVLALRNAVNHEGFGDLHSVRQCQILTNLANQLNTIGRFIEAVEMWDRALTLEPKFAMALGNRGRGLSSYAAALYDPGHRATMLAAAHDAFAAACVGDALWDNPVSLRLSREFDSERRRIDAHLDLPAIRENSDSEQYNLGRGEDERSYRSWCLRHRLFINPLNDLGPLPVAGHDVLTLPTITESSFSIYPPAIIGFFNQMKQEFVSARHLFYEGKTSRGVHFSDRDVLLYNTLDYPVYSLGSEKVRAAFRLSYSLLDKIAYFLNVYFAIGLNPKQVSFRSVWYETRGSRPLQARFSACQNWPLRGLFSISKDLFEEDFQRSTEPDAAALSEIRNHLEHKYLQLYEMMDPSTPDTEEHPLRYKLSKYDFEAKTLRLLKLTRAALIHLSLAVHSEERRRQSEEPQDGLSMPMPLTLWSDDWKQ